MTNVKLCVIDDNVKFVSLMTNVKLCVTDDKVNLCVIDDKVKLCVVDDKVKLCVIDDKVKLCVVDDKVKLCVIDDKVKLCVVDDKVKLCVIDDKVKLCVIDDKVKLCVVDDKVKLCVIDDKVKLYVIDDKVNLCVVDDKVKLCAVDDKVKFVSLMTNVKLCVIDDNVKFVSLMANVKLYAVDDKVKLCVIDDKVKLCVVDDKVKLCVIDDKVKLCVIDDKVKLCVIDDKVKLCVVDDKVKLCAVDDKVKFVSLMTKSICVVDDKVKLCAVDDKVKLCAVDDIGKFVSLMTLSSCVPLMTKSSCVIDDKVKTENQIKSGEKWGMWGYEAVERDDEDVKKEVRKSLEASGTVYNREPVISRCLCGVMASAFDSWVTPSDYSVPDLVILTYTNESTFLDPNDSSVWDNDTYFDSTAVPPLPWWMSHYPSGYAWPHIIFGAITITIIILMIIVGNFLVIWAILHDRTLKTTQNLFIMSLAFADFFLGTVVIPFSLTNELIGYWLFGVIWCELYKAIDVLLCTASIMSLCLISLDRYWSITRAVHYARQRTRKRAAIMIFTVWFISAVVSIPPLIGWKKPSRETQWPMCTLNEDIGYVVYSAFGSFFIPAFIMVFVYYKIYQAAKERARKNVSKAPTAKSSDKHDQKHSTESSVTEHAGNRDFSQDIDEEDNMSIPPDPHERDQGGHATDETVCDATVGSVHPTTSEDEAHMQVNRAKELTSSSAVHEAEYSRLLCTDSDSCEPSERVVIKLSAVKPDFEPIPYSDTDAASHRTAEVMGSIDTLSPHGEHTNGSLRRFKILELRANGSSALANEASRPESAKRTVLDSLRKRLLVRARNSRKRKPAPARSEGGCGKGAVDFQTADKQKKKLAKARERRATVVLGLVMAAFILCWLPFFSLYLASGFCPGCIPEMVFTVFFWIGYCNSALNPVIYTVFNRDFRRAFHKILFGRKRGRR
ncbi:Alpha-2B adrenergic receptor [Bulinus truncatus]|nr:Alpha-2B adrenergic receptor [Bulinus truncatus]